MSNNTFYVKLTESDGTDKFGPAKYLYARGQYVKNLDWGGIFQDNSTVSSELAQMKVTIMRYIQIKWSAAANRSAEFKRFDSSAVGNLAKLDLKC